MIEGMEGHLRKDIVHISIVAVRSSKLRLKVRRVLKAQQTIENVTPEEMYMTFDELVKEELKKFIAEHEKKDDEIENITSDIEGNEQSLEMLKKKCSLMKKIQQDVFEPED